MKKITSRYGQCSSLRTYIKSSVRFIGLTLLSLIITVSSTQIASALSAEQSRAFSQGLFKVQADRPCDETSAQTNTIPADASTTQRLQYIYTWFRGKGLTPIQAAAAVGNIAVESGGIANRVQGAGVKTNNDPAAAGSGGWGLIQWTPGSKVIGIAQKAGITGPIYETDTQLAIVMWHMKNLSATGVTNMLAGYTQTDIAEAVHYYERTMEGAGKPAYSVRTARAKIALQDYETASNQAQWDALHPTMGQTTPNNMWSASGSTTSTDSATGATTDPSAAAALSVAESGCSPSGVNSPGTGEGFVAKVTAYTWPYEWRNGPSPDRAAAKPTTLTAEYKRAIDQAKATNLYVGANGVDCGGYVTRLVRDSGLDPTYNNIKNGNIEGGPTATQSKYLQTSGKWRKIESGQPSSYYRPGDVAMQDGHTLIFVGDIASFWSVDTRTNKPVPPSELAKVPKANQRRVLLASASQDLRAPMADKDERVGSSAYTWYRYNGGTDTR